MMKLEDVSLGTDDIWGLSRHLHVHVGYDSEVRQADADAPGPDWLDPDGEDVLPTAEKLRLAEMMIARWKRYRIAVLEKEGAR